MSTSTIENVEISVKGEQTEGPFTPQRDAIKNPLFSKDSFLEALSTAVQAQILPENHIPKCSRYALSERKLPIQTMRVHSLGDVEEKKEHSRHISRENSPPPTPNSRLAPNMQAILTTNPKLTITAKLHSDNSSTTSNDSSIPDKISFLQIYEILQSVYNHDEAIQSTTLDIVGVYLKGQKILYIESKTYCEQHLYALMLPAILISAICSVLSVTLDGFNFGGTLVASLTAVNSFILTLITYLKLDAKAEAHKSTAYAFEKLQSYCEFNSGKILFSDINETPVNKQMKKELHEKSSEKVDYIQVLNHIEEKVREIKERNQFMIPEAIRFRYPILFSTNVFSEVKKIQNDEIILMNRLKVSVNNFRRIEYILEHMSKENKEYENYKTKFDAADKEQQDILEKIIKFRETYLNIDEKFKKEIDDNIANMRKSVRCCIWLKT